jgi:hypothetical protein
MEYIPLYVNAIAISHERERFSGRLRVSNLQPHFTCVDQNTRAVVLYALQPISGSGRDYIRSGDLNTVSFHNDVLLVCFLLMVLRLHRSL